MPAFPPAPRWKALFWLSCAALGAGSCGKHREAAPAKSEAPPPAPRAEPDPASALTGDTARPPAPEPKPAPREGIAFTSHPPKALLGRPFAYRPTVDFPGTFSLRLLKPADSAMRLEKGTLAWLPSRPGRFPVLLEAAVAAGPGAGAEHRAQQGFTLEVAPVLELSLKLPAQAGKGDSVAFDLRGSHWPAWAASALTVRFDWDGDGTWDTEAAPLPTRLLAKHAYAAIGRYAPRVEARYGSYETRQAQGALAIVSAVRAALKLAPDTVEPGGLYSVDASASRADGRLAYVFDLDGDGKPEWADSASTGATLKAPGSGTYRATLIARDPMGQEGKAEGVLRVNARPKLEFRVRNPKDNMAAAIDFKIRARDPDDSLRAVRFTFTGGSGDWETRAAPESLAAGREWLVRLKHAYGKVGKFAPKACAASADGRETCQELQVEIFNATPVCRPGPDLRATVGLPLAIDGTGEDPDGKIVKWEWDLDGDGKYDLVSAENGKFQYTFGKEGLFTLTLRVTTADGMTATGSRKVEVRKRWKT